MRAVELRSYEGGPATIGMAEKPLPRPGKGQVLIRMSAAPINPSDLMFVQGVYGIRKKLPVVPGLEGSGVIVAAGPGFAAQVLVGQRVACAAPDWGDGTWAEYMLTTANRCIPLLKHISNVQGAMLLVNPGTAWALVESARRGKHTALVQTAAAGALGQMILALGRRAGLTMLHIVRRQEQVDLLRELGAVHVLDSSAPDFDRQLRRLCQELKIRFAIDAVAGEMTGRLLHAMPNGARIVVYGALAMESCQIPPGDLIFQDKRIEGFWLASWIRRQTPLSMLRLGLGVQRMIGAELKTAVRACFPLEEVGRALELYSERMSEGKVLLMPELRR